MSISLPSITKWQMLTEFGESLMRWSGARVTNSIARVYALRLRTVFAKGQRRRLRRAQIDEFTDPLILSRSQVLSQQVLVKYQNYFKSSPYRILLELPFEGMGRGWFKDLIQCMTHMGIMCMGVEPNTPNFMEIWESFHPNVFVSWDSPPILKTLDWDSINQYKKTHGCLRLFMPVITHRFPKPGLSVEDRWRFEMARTRKTIDAFFSMMAPEFFQLFWPAWLKADFRYLSLPNACNPFRHFVTASIKKFDYFMVTSYGPERAEVTWRNLKPIFRNYYGAWGGTGWGFGVGTIRAKELRAYYACSRVALNPLQSYLRRFPAETTERSFSATACGAFQITNWTPVTGRFFKSDELVCAKNEREFYELFEQYVDRPAERNAVVLKGLERVLHEHTYFHRIEILIDFLKRYEGLF